MKKNVLFLALGFLIWSVLVFMISLTKWAWLNNPIVLFVTGVLISLVIFIFAVKK